MSVTIESAVLARAMKSAATIVESANTIPILSNVRLQADGDQMEIITSNLDIEYRQHVPLIGSGSLFTTVSAAKLAAIAGAGAGAQMNLEVKDGRLTVKMGRNRTTLPVLPPEDFPAMPFDTHRVSVEVGGRQLAGFINRTAWSASTEETRYYLCGIYLDPEDGKIRFTTTNGHTIACLTTELEWPEEAPVAIVPSKFCRTVERVASETETVSLQWGDAKVRLIAGSVVLTGKLVSGTFPDYRRVIPAPGAQPTLVDPENLRKALKRIEIVGSDKTRSIAMERQMGALEIVMADASGGGHAVENVPADCAANAERIGFNAGYLGSALEAIGGDTVEIHLAAANEVALIRRAVPDGAICGVMPMRV